MKFLSDTRLPFWLLTINAITWLIIFPLFRDGMFMDGVQYAAVARNLAKGIGSFWFPVFSDNYVAGLNSFHEHPPLVYYLQSFFFKIFGTENIYPERIYGLITLVFTGYFIILIWKKVFEHNLNAGKHWWLPLLLWVSMPIVFWSYVNNVHEITVALFTTMAIYFFVCTKTKKNIAFSIYFLSGVFCVLLAFLCKGVPALFPLAFYVIHFLVFRKISFLNILVATVMAIVILAIAALLILLIPEAKESLHIWFFDRMVYRIANNPVAGNHFYIIEGLFTEQLPALLFCVILFVTYKFYKIENKVNGKEFLFYLLLALSGSLPLMLTLVQRNFYFVPSLPFFAIAWGIIVANGVEVLVNKFYVKSIIRKVTNTLLTIIFIAGIISTYYFAGTIKREKLLLQDVYALGEKINNTTVCVPAEIMWNNWQFRCYMMRYNSVAFSANDTCLYYIDYKNGNSNSRYSETSLKELNLFQLLVNKAE